MIFQEQIWEAVGIIASIVLNLGVIQVSVKSSRKGEKTNFEQLRKELGGGKKESRVQTLKGNLEWEERGSIQLRKFLSKKL